MGADGSLCALDGDALSHAIEALERENLFAPLLSRLGHDLRSPLNAASLHLVLLRRIAKGEGTQEQLLEWIAQLSCELERLGAMADALCATSPPPPDEEDEDLDLYTCLTQMTPAANALACHLGTSFEVEKGQPPTLRLRARPKHLTRALLELTARLLTAARTETTTETTEAAAALQGLTVSPGFGDDSILITFSGLPFRAFQEPAFRLATELRRLGCAAVVEDAPSIGDPAPCAGCSVLTLRIPVNGKDYGP